MKFGFSAAIPCILQWGWDVLRLRKKLHLLIRDLLKLCCNYLCRPLICSVWAEQHCRLCSLSINICLIRGCKWGSLSFGSIFLNVPYKGSHSLQSLYIYLGNYAIPWWLDKIMTNNLYLMLFWWNLELELGREGWESNGCRERWGEVEWKRGVGRCRER